MKDLTQKVTKTFKEIHSLLDSVHDKYWADWSSGQVKKFDLVFSADSNRQNKIFMINEALNKFGGMGSFNDLILCEQNGHKIKNLEKDNARLDKLRHRLFMELEELKLIAENYSDGQN